MKILVTGAAGFIGSHLAERLVKEGHVVTGLDNFSDFYAKGLKQFNVRAIEAAGVTFTELDLLADGTAQALENVEAVFHLAAQPGLHAQTDFKSYFDNNVKATFNLLKAASQLESQPFFFYISTSSVYGLQATRPEDSAPRPVSHYGTTKLAAEYLSLSYRHSFGLPVCILRLFSVYGERERPEKLYPKLIKSILEKKEFPLHRGSERHVRSFTYVGDIVDGLVAALNKRMVVLGETINLGSDQAITTARGINIIEKLLGERARIKSVPQRPGDQLKTQANIEKAKRLLGYKPKVNAETGLAREVEWFKKNWGSIKGL